jgi:PIN domain nuclease of toxin-antitoxin system
VVRAEVIYLDTHVVIRVGQREYGKLGQDARRAIERGDLLVSAAVVLEMEMLYEIGRLKLRASQPWRFWPLISAYAFATCPFAPWSSTPCRRAGREIRLTG